MRRDIEERIRSMGGATRTRQRKHLVIGSAPTTTIRTRRTKTKHTKTQEYKQRETKPREREREKRVYLCGEKLKNPIQKEIGQKQPLAASKKEIAREGRGGRTSSG